MSATQSEQTEQSEPIRSSRKRLVLLLTPFVLAVVGAVAWWFGPWNAENRYRRMDLVSLRRMLETDPQNALGWRTLGLRLAKDGDAGMSEPALRQAYALRPNDTEVAIALGELLMGTNRYPEAFQLLKSATELSPKLAGGHYALGRLYQRKGSYLKAATEFEKVAALNQMFPDVWYELTICYLQMQQAKKAKDAIAEALRQDPRDPRYLALKGSVDVAVGDVDTGIAATQEAARIAPRDLKIQSTLANLLLANHRSPEDLNQAEEVIGRVEQINPDYPLLPYQRGELERLRQNWVAAARYLERALQTARNQDEVYFSLSQVYRRLNRNEEADKLQAIFRRRQDLHRKIDEVRIALGGNPDDLKMHGDLADLLVQLGDREGAISTLEAALQIDPKSAEIQSRLRVIRAGSMTQPQGTP